MNPLIKQTLTELGNVALSHELMHMAVATHNPEIIEFASTLKGIPENEVRRASYLKLIGIESVQEFQEKYRQQFNASCPEELADLLFTYNLDSPIVLDAVADNGDFNHLARLQEMYFFSRGKSFVKDYKAFRSVDNVSGKPNFFALGSGSKKTRSSATNNTLMIGGAIIRYPKEVQLQEVVAYATADEFWSQKKAAEVVMSKLYANCAASGEPVTLEYVESMIESIGAKAKDVAEQIRWTLDGSYSKYGWSATYDEEKKLLTFTPINWDGFVIPDGAISYSEYKRNRKK